MSLVFLSKLKSDGLICKSPEKDVHKMSIKPSVSILNSVTWNNMEFRVYCRANFDLVLQNIKKKMCLTYRNICNNWNNLYPDKLIEYCFTFISLHYKKYAWSSISL